MEQQKIDRINALARKAKTEGLTPEEAAEQKLLRQEYIDAFRRSARAQLDSIVIKEQDGTLHPLKKRS